MWLHWPCSATRGHSQPHGSRQSCTEISLHLQIDHNCTFLHCCCLHDCPFLIKSIFLFFYFNVLGFVWNTFHLRQSTTCWNLFKYYNWFFSVTHRTVILFLKRIKKKLSMPNTKILVYTNVPKLHYAAALLQVRRCNNLGNPLLCITTPACEPSGCSRFIRVN